jgi:hypothetical protein
MTGALPVFVHDSNIVAYATYCDKTSVKRAQEHLNFVEQSSEFSL